MTITSESTEIDQAVSTGLLPSWESVESLAAAAFQRYRGVGDGTVADYIPALADTAPSRFGLSLIETGGSSHDIGDTAHQFSIQSISKAFVYALVRDAFGHGAVKDRVGVNNTGLPFNSVMALELNDGHPMNPMVNAGAIATTALLPGDTPDDKWETILSGLSAFAGRRLEMDDDVYRSEMRTNARNKALARLLQSYGRLDDDPLEMVDVYTRQCSLLVTSHDLAVMGATLADGGTNPVTSRRVVSPETCQDTLAMLAASGMYERSGEWLFEIGLPAKSGVSGGIVAVAPGKGAVGTFSAPLDSAGNSVRGQRAIAYLSRGLGLNLFASRVPPRTGRTGRAAGITPAEPPEPTNPTAPTEGAPS
jgi:glutaminase